MKICYVETEAIAFTTHRKHLGEAALAAGHEVHLIAPGGDPRGQLSGGGFVYHSLPLARGGMNPIGEARAVGALARLFRKLRPAVVHNFAIKSVLYGAIAARSVGVPAVVGSITGLGYAFMPGGRRRAALTRGVTMSMRVALAGSHVRVIVQNPDDAAFFVERGIVTKERLSIVYGSGVDTQEFAPAPEPPGVPVVVLGARMLWDKGLGELVEAVRRLRERGLSFRCLLLGDPDAHNPTSLTVAQLQSWVGQGLIEWLPRTSEVARHLREATVACLPSYREGLPLFLAEAAAAGRACVTTDVPGCRSVVEHGVTGLVVPARDAGSLAEAWRSCSLMPRSVSAWGKMAVASPSNVFPRKSSPSRSSQCTSLCYSLRNKTARP